jgi:uncharacterized protein (DUF58 family)
LNVESRGTGRGQRMRQRRDDARSRTPLLDPRLHADFAALVRLQVEARGFSLKPDQPLRSALHGRHASRLRGRGLDFEELREYVVGDDIRDVDWRASARTGSTHVRIYSEERDRPVWILVSQRQSMYFGSRDRLKSVAAAEVAALLAWRVLIAGDRVGAMVFDDDEIETFRPQRSREQVLRILRLIVQKNHALAVAKRTSPHPGILNEALERLIPLAPHDALICLIGDGSDADATTQRLVTRLAAQNDLVFAAVFDPLEAELPAAGRLTASDGERWIEFDSASETGRRTFAERHLARLDWIRDVARARAIPLLPIDTLGPVAPQIRSQLGFAREARRV